MDGDCAPAKATPALVRPNIFPICVLLLFFSSQHLRERFADACNPFCCPNGWSDRSTGVWLRFKENNIFTQMICRASSDWLQKRDPIVEFAQADPGSRRQGSLHRRGRRPAASMRRFLMTYFAFIFGVLPLVSAKARRGNAAALGPAVFSECSG